MTRETAVARVAYAILFVVMLPLALAWWAQGLDAVIRLPPVGSPLAGIVLVGSGLLLALAAARDLWVHGRGLPMSAFPPEQLVSTGSYRLVRDPIYLGVVVLAGGIAIVGRSPAGIWIVTPVLAMACAVWVHGFERARTVARFGVLPAPWLRLPPDSEGPVTWQDRISVLLLVFLPWLVLYLAVERLGAPAWAPVAYLPGEGAWPVVPWTEAIYAATYPLVVLAPLLARTRADLRRFAVGGLLATAVAIPLYLLVPVIAPAKPVPGDGFWQDLMRWERQGDSPVTALPAFHIVWAMLAAQAYASRWPRARISIWFGVAAIAISCITTGMHAVLDLAAGVALFAVVERRAQLWQLLRRGAEYLANSWREWSVGPIRVLSHGAWAGLAGAVGLGVALWLVGIGHLGGVLLLMWVGIISSAVWAQVIEGSPQLLRPFGYFGSVVGALPVAVVLEIGWGTGWLLLAALATALAFAQAIGRARCLVQGCCHGRQAPDAVGISYRHPATRVVRLAELGGVPIHPTPLYSMGWMLLVGAVLVRLWHAGTAPTFILGCYFILTGLGRFLEEHFRGEPQTAVHFGLRLYQWLALAFVVGGAIVTTVPGPSVPGPTAPGFAVVPVLLLAGVLTWAAFGVDLPRSARRYSRLT